MKFFEQFIHDKNSLKSKQNTLTALVGHSTRYTNLIQTNISNLQSINGEIDATVKEIEDTKMQYSVLEKELQNRKAQNESIIAMFSAQK